MAFRDSQLKRLYVYILKSAYYSSISGYMLDVIKDTQLLDIDEYSLSSKDIAHYMDLLLEDYLILADVFRWPKCYKDAYSEADGELQIILIQARRVKHFIDFNE